MDPAKSLKEALAKIKHPLIMEWKNSGKPVVGTTCSYVPPELLHAGGILPVRLRGIEAEGTEVGDAYFGPFICSFPKCLLQIAGTRGFDFIDGAIITPGCDAMRRLDECWRKAGNDIDGIVPPFFYYFDVPHKSEGHGLAWFTAEIEKLKNAVSDHFKVNIDSGAIKESIEIYNQGRASLAELEAMREDEDVRITGTEAFAAAVAGTVLPREDYNRLLAEFVSDVKKREPDPERRIRLVIAGSVDDAIDLIELIENTSKAVVVGETLCFGSRYQGEQVDTSMDPIEALASHYLAGSVCPRMFGQYKKRFQRLLHLVESRRAHGVILQNIRFCDMHGSENGLFARDLAARGIPSLVIEREYGPIADMGRIRMRIDAFLEQLSAKNKKGGGFPDDPGGMQQAKFTSIQSRGES